jgi:hypothetical protein
MPLARKVGGVAVLLKKLGYGRRLLFERILVARSDHDGQRPVINEARPAVQKHVF